MATVHKYDDNRLSTLNVMLFLQCADMYRSPSTASPKTQFVIFSKIVVYTVVLSISLFSPSA